MATLEAQLDRPRRLEASVRRFESGHGVERSSRVLIVQWQVGVLNDGLVFPLGFLRLVRREADYARLN